MDIVNTLVQGILVGGLYALFAAGLGLIFGVMRMVNIAHGDLIVLAAYVAMVVVNATGLHPLLTLIVVVPLMGGFGYVLQLRILNRTLGKDILPPLLVSFGLSVILQNGLLEVLTADSRKLRAGALETASFTAGGISIGYLPLLMFGTAVAVVAGLLAVPVAALVFRLQGAYFAIGTWVVAEVFRLLAAQMTVLGGGSGVSLPIHFRNLGWYRPRGR